MSAAIYLDCAATTPVDARVARAMHDCLVSDTQFGNAASAHVYGREASRCIEAARAQVAALVGAGPDEIVFTSGATASNNVAILGCLRGSGHRGRHLITLRTEHRSVLDVCRRLERDGCSVTWLTPARDGRLDLAALAAALRPDTVLVSVMHVNNETGVIEDVAAIGALCRARGIAFHCDCAQSVGRLPVNLPQLGCDFAAFTAHKIYGPKGIGALYVRRGARALLQPLMFGGGQERGLYPGTLATHQIVGFGAAAELAAQALPAESARLAELCERLWRGVATLGGTHLNGAAAPRAAGIVNISFEGVQGESLLAGIGELAVSTGAACSSDSPDASYVLRALGRSTALAHSSLRFSPGRFTQAAEIDAASAVVRREVSRLRALSPAAAPPVAAGAGLKRVSGEAGGPAEDTWVRFELGIAGDSVKEARFRALACPHTMEVARWLEGELPGRTRQGLIPGTPAAWATAHAVPVDKLGRLLVVEDALRACLTNWP
jgi:cysteine desulfurase